MAWPDMVDAGSDSQLPTLRHVLNPLELREYLLLAGMADWTDITSVEVRVLQLHPGRRCTVEIELVAGNQRQVLIGKVYSTDRSDVHRAMDWLWRSGLGPESAFAIPRPVTAVPALNLLLQERIVGRAAKDEFLAGTEGDRTLAAERSARWLAWFHATASGNGPLFDPLHQLESMERWARRIATLGGSPGSKATRLFDALAGASRQMCSGTPCAGHGSYGPAHVILSGGRTVTIDWDGYDVADPARDVARFVAALQRLALGRLRSVHALDAAAETFQAAYLAEGRSDVAPRLAFFKAAMCLQLAKYDVHHQVSDWREKVDVMLDEGQRHLEEQIP